MRTHYKQLCTSRIRSQRNIFADAVSYKLYYFTFVFLNILGFRKNKTRLKSPRLAIAVSSTNPPSCSCTKMFDIQLHSLFYKIGSHSCRNDFVHNHCSRSFRNSTKRGFILSCATRAILPSALPGIILSVKTGHLYFTWVLLKPSIGLRIILTGDAV